MFRSFLQRFSMRPVWPSLLLILAGASVATLSIPRDGNAQVTLPRAGKSFTFGIFEGPYSFIDSVSFLNSTSLTLTVVSEYSGCGIISSPSGYTEDFNFTPGVPTIINLPLNLIQNNDQGETNKGLLVHTTEPVNLVLHDYAQYGGDASQILPDNALDTSYVTFGWGIWDDVGEDDADEFIVTAVSDSTLVTITPSIRTELGQPDSVPFTAMLNRGDCYIVKADTSDHPSDPSLSGSTIHASKPVSVISGLTCAYVPVAVEACNELMDELIGKKWWGSHFFTQPLDPNDSGGELVFTSSRNFFAKINSNVYPSSHGRVETSFTGPVEIHITDSLNNPTPVEAHQLTRSYSYCDSELGDPSLVTVLDSSYYSDTLLWNTPSYEFSHSAPIICPTVDLSRATLDGTPLSLLGPSHVINGSSYSSINPYVSPGEHRVISPDPVFGIAAGFYVADAYTFIAGTAGTQLPRDTANHVLQLKADSARMCAEFDVTASLTTPILSSEGLIEFSISVVYDPSTLHLLEVIPLSLLTNGTYTIDTSVLGRVTITVQGNPLITGDSLFRLVFEGWKATVATSIGLSPGSVTSCGDDSEIVSNLATTFPILQSNDSLRRQFLLSNSPAVICQPLNINLFTDSMVLPQDGLVLSKIVLFFNPATERFLGLTPGTLLTYKPFSDTTVPAGTVQVLLTPSASISGGNSIMLYQFLPQMPSASDTIRAQVYYIECGDTLERNVTIIFPIANNNPYIAPNTLLFDSTVTCLPLDTTILIGDSSCEPYTLTSVSVTGTDWTVLNANGQPLFLPSTVQGHSGEQIQIKFQPHLIGSEQDTVTLHYTYFDSTYTRTIVLSGRGIAEGKLQYPQSLNFGSTSLCASVDSDLTFNNQTCDTAKIDSVSISAPFVLIGQVPISLPSGKNTKLKIQYAPHAVETDTGFAILTLTVNDTLVYDTLSLDGIGTPSGTVQYPKTLNFGNASPCSPTPTDSEIIFTNKTCDTATIDSVVLTAPFGLAGQLPISIGAGLSGKLPVQFAPDSLSSDTGREIVFVTVNGKQQKDTVTFYGTGKSLGTLAYAGSINFGNVSLCAPVDTELIFSNSTCDSAIVDSILASPPFQLLDSLPFSVASDTNGGLRIRFAPNATSSDTERAIITITENGIPKLDTLTFIGKGVAGGAVLLSTAPEDSIIFTRSQCDPPDTADFYLFNPGCDSLIFGSGFNIFSDSIGSWNLLAVPASGLPAGDSILIGIISNDSSVGVHNGQFLTSFVDSNGRVRQFPVWISETITPAPRTMAIDTTPIDLGIIQPCQAIDTTIPFTNTSCIPVDIIGWNLSSFDSAFNVFGTGQHPPYPVPAYTTDSLHVTFDGSQAGVIYDTVIVLVGTDNNITRKIPVQITVPPVDSVHFHLVMPPMLAEDSYFSAGVFPDEAVSASKGLTSISGRFLYLDNDFFFDSVSMAPGLQLTTKGPSRINGVDEVSFLVSNAAGITLDPNTPIVQLWLQSLLTDSIAYSISLDSVLLNGGDPNFSRCTLATSGIGASAQYAASCGDSLIIEQLQGRALIFASAPTPNPVSGEEGGYIATITLQSSADGMATLEIFDELGRSISHENLSMPAGESVSCPLDLRAAPAGSYFYTVRYVSAYGTTARNGSVLVIR